MSDLFFHFSYSFEICSGSSDTAVDFDFLIEGVFLRTSLEEYLSDNNLTLVSLACYIFTKVF